MNHSNIIRCPVCGLSYDNRRDPGCPDCSRQIPGLGRIEGADGGATVIKNANFASFPDETISVGDPLPGDLNDVTVGVGMSRLGNRHGEISGWLVCVSGPDFGRDFRLRYNNNFIGRDMDMEVCLASDNAVHKSKHMSVVYEPKERKFFCGPCGGALCALNGESLNKTSQLRDYDRIKLGNTELVFRSFCGEAYQW